MADTPKKKISQLSAVSSVNMADYFEVAEPQNNGASWVSKSMTIEQLRNYIFQAVFPVGALYLTLNSTNPTNLFGGTWELYAQGRTLFGVDTAEGDTNFKKKWGSAGKTGGVEGGNLVLDENTMPQHRHNLTAKTVANKGAIEFGIRHPYDPNSTDPTKAMTPSMWLPGDDKGAVVSHGSPHTWNTGTVTKSYPNGKEKGDKVTIKLPSIETTVDIQENGSGSAVSVYPPYVTCYIWRKTSNQNSG